VERIWRAAINSWNGLVAITRSEAAFRQELALLAIGIPLAFILTPAAAERFALIGIIAVADFAILPTVVPILSLL
jgi:diacylglycerol kinase (ATP)